MVTVRKPLILYPALSNTGYNGSGFIVLEPVFLQAQTHPDKKKGGQQKPASN
jgi:hypothetical protein